jgi:hypothetical protein
MKLRVFPCQTLVHGCKQLGAAIAQGQSHPQRAITQFTRGADREAVLQRLAGTAPQDLPRAVSEVAVSHEDAAGGTALRGTQHGVDMPSADLWHCASGVGIGSISS